MYSIQKVETNKMVNDVHKVITQAFSTVAQEFHFTKESVPRFPAFINLDIIQKQIDNGLVMFAYVEAGNVLGSVGIKKEENNIYKIERLAVLPEKRHQNIGQTLMNYALECIKEQNGITAIVEIVYENDVLKKWYEHHGFQVKAIEKYDHLPFQVGVLSKDIC